MPRQIVGKFTEARGATRQKFRVVPAVLHQGVGDAQHHRHVGAHMRRDPLGAVTEEIQRFRTHRVDADDALAAFTQRIEVGHALLVGGIPGNFQGIERVGAPQHHHLRMLQHQRPAGLLLIDLISAYDIRHDRLRRTGRVITQMAGIAPGQAHVALQQGCGLMQHAVRAPAIGAGKNRRRAIAVANAFMLRMDQRQRVIPAHANELILPANALWFIR